jgi:glyoxylase-like metal-dependent hydrolase (beta-lactamase superfamily II)
MKIANHIEVLAIPFMDYYLYPTIVTDDQNTVLVDTGFPGQAGEILQAMAEAGIAADQLSRIILTHQDFDHSGGLQEILKAAGQAVEVIAHIDEKPYIEGEKPPYKLSPERLGQIFASVAADKRQEEEAKFLQTLKARVQRVVKDGELLPFGGGMTVIHTPGHTPGHISLYHQPSKTLITGDALTAVDGRLVGPNPVFTPDLKLAKESVRKLTAYDIETAVCYHGGGCRDDINDRIRKLAR